MNGLAQQKAFPKSARLRKSRDFTFRLCRRYQSSHFTFLYSPEGSGRLGISVSKRVLKKATARNRVRRLIRESFRLLYPEMLLLDVNVIGNPSLTAHWRDLTRTDVENEFRAWVQRAARPPIQ